MIIVYVYVFSFLRFLNKEILEKLYENIKHSFRTETLNNPLPFLRDNESFAKLYLWQSKVRQDEHLKWFEKISVEKGAMSEHS